MSNKSVWHLHYDLNGVNHHHRSVCFIVYCLPFLHFIFIIKSYIKYKYKVVLTCIKPLVYQYSAAIKDWCTDCYINVQIVITAL